jgi:hypothetical protein
VVFVGAPGVAATTESKSVTVIPADEAGESLAAGGEH